MVENMTGLMKEIGKYVFRVKAPLPPWGGVGGDGLSVVERWVDSPTTTFRLESIFSFKHLQRQSIEILILFMHCMHRFH